MPLPDQHPAGPTQRSRPARRRPGDEFVDMDRGGGVPETMAGPTGLLAVPVIGDPVTVLPVEAPPTWQDWVTFGQAVAARHQLSPEPLARAGLVHTCSCGQPETICPVRSLLRRLNLARPL